MSLLSKYIRVAGNQNEKGIEETVRSFLPVVAGKYLDCGCDDGKKTILRAKVIGTTKVFGLDNNKNRLKIAAKRGVKTYLSDLNTKWKLKSNQFEVITATEVIEHMIDVDNFLSESKRVLKKQGILILSTENLASWHNVFALVLGNQPYTGPYISKVHPAGHHPLNCFQKESFRSHSPHINVMTYKALVVLLNKYGFEVQENKGVGYYPLFYPFSKILSSIGKYHSTYVVIKAKKK